MPISVFVPPHNALSKRGLEAVSAAGLNILGSFLRSDRRWPRDGELQPIGGPSFATGATGRRRRDPLVYPHALRYARHAEFGCHTLVPGTTAENLRRHLQRRARPVELLPRHALLEIDPTLKSEMRTFLDFAAGQPDVRFVPAEELFG
jgi:hypothetical protein